MTTPAERIAELERQILDRHNQHVSLTDEHERTLADLADARAALDRQRDREPITVEDLGEDGDAWIVKGTDNRDTALAAVDQHAAQTYGPSSDEYENIKRLLPVARTTAGTWWWKSYCSHDAELVSIDADLPPELFRGVRVHL
jgi:hypothetical protein